MRYENMKLSVGIFVLVLVFSLSGFTYFLLDAKGVFEKQYRYYFVTESAAFFTIGMPLKFSGFAIGNIDDIELKDDGDVLIHFAVTNENRKWINRYTHLMLKKPLIGSAHIEVYATSEKEYLEVDSRLPIVITDDINDLVTKFEPVVERLLHIIENIETMTNELSKGDSSFNKTIKNLELFSEKLAKNDALLTTVTGDKKATQAMIDSVNELNQILQNINGATKDLKRDIIEPTSLSIKEFYNILNDVNKKLKTLEPLIQNMGESGSDIKVMRQSIKHTIEKTDALMEKIDTLLQDQSKNEVELP
ncbi:MlaD family protein [Sulfurimonas marina]|uniref:MCE family protein n=1 Tax=Sulfurimonas marina TaxID=2590551 RepID=A0A7M3V942_9BACT|nr:hypothetical protein [Sulfurimonas marina]QOP40275.1 hypothetical protein FJR03_00375 [Sulfurimonas marina]